MDEHDDAPFAFRTSRHIPAQPAQVFAAFTDAARLATWWGPAGFSNTFEFFDFTPGGHWRFVMHGPDGKNYRNESMFEQVEPARLVVIRHLSAPHYRLTISLEPASEGGTVVHWEQIFDKPSVARAIAHIVEPANEQNLDRLSAQVLGSGSVRP